MEWITELLKHINTSQFYGVLNSQFVSTLLSALAGAFAGALAAQRIALKSKDKESIENQVRAINLAISSSFLICNSALGMKNQHVNSMYKAFNSEKARFEEALKNPPQGQVVEFQSDLKTLHMPSFPIIVLENTVYESVSITGRPLALVSTLSNSIDALRGSLERRNTVIENFKSLFPTLNDEDRLKTFFGLPLRDGSVNQEYSDIVHAIHSYLDDVIFYSSKICKDFNEQGDKLRNIYIKRYGKGIEKITSFDFNTPEAEAIWPDEGQYDSWLCMFQKPEVELPWYKRILNANK